MNELDPLIYAIRHARLSRGISQLELARRIGTAQSAISEIETGETSPTLATLRRIAPHVGIAISAVDVGGSAATLPACPEKSS